MELIEIEPYAYEVIYPDYDGELFYSPFLAKKRAVEVGGWIRTIHTKDQLTPIISYLEERIAKVGEYSSGNEILLYQGIKSAFRDTRKLIEEAQDEEVCRNSN